MAVAHPLSVYLLARTQGEAEASTKARRWASFGPLGLTWGPDQTCDSNPHANLGHQLMLFFIMVGINNLDVNLGAHFTLFFVLTR